jgi:hypothetical protein
VRSKNVKKDLDQTISEPVDKVVRGIQYLLEGLEELGLIDVTNLFEMGVSTNVVKIRFSKRINYEDVAEWLKEGYPVFIPIDKRRAYYAEKRLSEILGVKVKKKPAMWENREKGYLFFF